MANGCKYTLGDSVDCNHIMGVDIEIWLMVGSALLILIAISWRIVYGMLFKGEKFIEIATKLAQDDDGDDDDDDNHRELKGGSLRGIISTLTDKDDD